MKLKKHLKTALRVATDIIPKIPEKDDGLLTTIVKIIGVADSIAHIAAKGNVAYSFFESLNAEEMSNGQPIPEHSEKREATSNADGLTEAQSKEC